MTIQRPLLGFRVGISISEGEDSEEVGFPSRQVSHLAVQVAASLLDQGAGVAFGHDWREGGVMEAVHVFALQLHPFAPESSTPDSKDPPIIACLAWPDEPSLSLEMRERLRSTLKVVVASPQDRAVNEDRNIARANALTKMRQDLNTLIDARVCFGGRKTTSQGWLPGVIEEAWYALSDKKPVYFCGLIGGATAQMISAIKKKPFPPSFADTPLNNLIVSGNKPKIQFPSNRKVLWDHFAELGIETISKCNGLTPDENEALFNAKSVQESIRLVLTGMGRLT